MNSKNDIFERVEGEPTYKPKVPPDVLKRFNDFMDAGRKSGLMQLYAMYAGTTNPQEMANEWADSLGITNREMSYNPMDAKLVEAFRQGLLNDEISAIMGGA